VDSKEVRDVRVDLAAVHRVAVMEGWHEGTWNHFSAKVPEHEDHLLLTPGHTHFSRVSASNLLLAGPDGTILDGSGVPNESAWAIHHPLHEARPDVGCALHAHTPYATALSTLDGWQLNERAHQHSAKFFRRMAYYDYQGTVTSTKEGEQIAEALEEKRALIMANHGVLVVGETIEEAALYLLVLERACRTELLAMSTGYPISKMPKAVAKKISNHVPGFGELGYLDAMKAVLDHRGEDYAK
jgi:ribulose-5-phosphate 4-epimerase/fuculose-1-phosphate aldolase